jgi:D-serine deaminase-like pyridoxal phosphate-dependent protein
MTEWWDIENAYVLETPALLVSPAMIARNLDRTIADAGGAHRLWPHVKTHKLAPVMRMSRERGISHFKCATLAEAEMCGAAGAERVLLAMAVTGCNLKVLRELARSFPRTRFASLADCGEHLDALEAAALPGERIEVFLDLDCGMGRTGIAPSTEAEALWRSLCERRALFPAGLHTYDGHIQAGTTDELAAQVAESSAPVQALRERLALPALIAGGTPSFPFHAARGDVAVSPGTTALWSWCIAEKCPEMRGYDYAAVLATRVVSRPASGRLTLDLGHKAVAAENPLSRRVKFPALPDAVVVSQSEEHLVVETSRTRDFPPGTMLFGYPWHICPTVALHSHVAVVENHRAVGRWNVTARDRHSSLPLIDS